ncbi:MAG TPA: aminotransferase class V-fold PLP-dependent enzyme [Stellaceae bacterium]|jgi:cysteine desulfurase|nr:aminotransferase class V-fold PLP-dependent enzyme [Stellaceae bacterium]
MRDRQPIYLDCAATTPMDSRVAELVMRLFVDEFGNAGSRTHTYGAAAQREVGIARERLAATMDCEPEEVIFTSGATESDNLAILGLSKFGASEGRRHIISTAIEHKAVLEPLGRLAEGGFEVTLVSPDRAGYVSASDVLAAIRPETLLVSVMHANNETGALQPIAEIANDLPADDGPFFHVDAAQTYGRETPTLRHRRIDMISISGHKVFGPKGVGALVARRRSGRRLPLQPLMVGGGQERGLRPGTQPVPLIAGLGLAAELANVERVSRTAACVRLRDEALAALAPLEPVMHGNPVRGVLANILSVAIPGLDSEAVMVALKDQVAISNGSACTSARYEPSHVLAAMGLSEEEVAGTVRLSWCHSTPEVAWRDVVAILSDLRL